jgi:tRNA 2-thiouridine synthesizing protein A
MADEIKTVQTLDLKGMVCPIPIVKVSQAVKAIQIGEVIEAFATDPGVLGDIPAWCKTSGNELVKMEKIEKNFRFVVRKLK